MPVVDLASQPIPGPLQQSDQVLHLKAPLLVLIALRSRTGRGSHDGSLYLTRSRGAEQDCDLALPEAPASHRRSDDLRHLRRPDLLSAGVRAPKRPKTASQGNYAAACPRCDCVAGGEDRTQKCVWSAGPSSVSEHFRTKTCHFKMTFAVSSGWRSNDDRVATVSNAQSRSVVCSAFAAWQQAHMHSRRCFPVSPIGGECREFTGKGLPKPSGACPAPLLKFVQAKARSTKGSVQQKS